MATAKSARESRTCRVDGREAEKRPSGPTCNVSGGKFVLLPNGITPRQVSDRQPVAKYAPLTPSYCGTLFVGRSPEPILQAVAFLIWSGTVASEGIRIKPVGRWRNIEGVPTASLIREHGIDSVVQVYDSVSHWEAADIIRRGQFALLSVPHLPYAIPAESCDYLETGTLVPTITREGGTVDFSRETDDGLAFSPQDIDGIRECARIEMAAGLPHNGRHAAAVASFDAGAITEQLVGHLGRIEALESRP